MPAPREPTLVRSSGPKAREKSDLHVIAYFLIAKQDYGVFLERFAHCAIGSVVGRHINQIAPT
jgi:hypothetical protein